MAEIINIKLLETGNLFIEDKELFTMEEIISSTGKTRQTIYNWVGRFKLSRIDLKGRPFFYFNE